MSGEIRKALKDIDGAEASTRNWGVSLRAVKRGILAVGAAATAALGFGVKVAADLQTAEIGLTTLLRSSDEARKTIDRLKIEAARTPFELTGLTQATQLLTAVTKDGDESINILLDVGEALAAMGKGQAELDRIIVNLQQIGAVGHASMIDIKQFAFAGIPIYEMLTDVTGKSGEALSELISSGGVTFDLLKQMFDEANDAGGRFFGAFENQTGTFNQALSNAKDSLSIFLADVATKSGLLDWLTNGLVNISDTVGNYQTVFENAKSIIAEFFDKIDEKTLIITYLKESFGAWVEMYDTLLKPALLDLMEALRPLKPFGEALATVFGGMLVAAFHIVITAVNLLVAATVILLRGLTKLATFISNVLAVSINYLSGVIQLVVAVFKGDWAGALDVVQAGIENVYNWILKLIDGFKSAIALAKEIGGGAIDFVKGAIQGRATGGQVSAGTPYVVGEKGPELFMPSLSGSIVPNNALSGIGGVNVTIYGDVTGEALVDKVKRAIAGDLKGQIRV